MDNIIMEILSITKATVKVLTTNHLINYSLAEPIVRKELHNMPDGSVFIYCLVGDKAYWKDPNNEFRKNLKLTGVPTLLKYGTPQKLVEEECFKAELVRMLFTED
ncbi:PREDICTED: thioredoxin domain-containing protein 17 [Tinamus guttatus]|nr:PREDICTED: thioredoxin domain-containing protein 17 [Tinamus guttatus]